MTSYLLFLIFAVIRYSRQELFNLAEAQLEVEPPNWSSIREEFPVLERKKSMGSEILATAEEKKAALPYDWEHAFRYANLAVQPVHCVGSESNNNNNNNVVTVKKKNFLEVLNPNAPLRTWNEELGEWVEVKETRG